MFSLVETKSFTLWLSSLRDSTARTRIVTRLRRMQLGNAGDVKSVGGGVFEIKIDYAGGYRVYFVRHKNEVILLLCGGDKSSQSNDIMKAKALAKEYTHD